MIIKKKFKSRWHDSEWTKNIPIIFDKPYLNCNWKLLDLVFMYKYAKQFNNIDLNNVTVFQNEIMPMDLPKRFVQVAKFYEPITHYEIDIPTRYLLDIENNDDLFLSKFENKDCKYIPITVKIASDKTIEKYNEMIEQEKKEEEIFYEEHPVFRREPTDEILNEYNKLKNNFKKDMLEVIKKYNLEIVFDDDYEDSEHIIKYKNYTVDSFIDFPYFLGEM